MALRKLNDRSYSFSRPLRPPLFPNPERFGTTPTAMTHSSNAEEETAGTLRSASRPQDRSSDTVAPSSGRRHAVLRKALRVLRRTAAAGAVIFVASFAFLETKAGLSKIVDWGLYDPQPSCTLCDRLPDASAVDLIAHAGGEIDGLTYTNSLEALESSLEGGFRFIELDLRRTLDNRYFAAHRVKEFNAMTGYAENFEIPPTASDVRGRMIDGKYTPILLEDLAPLFEKHPERVLVTDKANRYRKLLDEFPLPDQLLVEVRNVDQYVAAKLAGVPNVAVDTADPDVVRRYGIELVVVSPALPRKALEALRAAGAKVLLATYESCEDIPEAARELASLAYVDTCPTGRVESDISGRRRI